MPENPVIPENPVCAEEIPASPTALFPTAFAVGDHVEVWFDGWNTTMLKPNNIRFDGTVAFIQIGPDGTPACEAVIDAEDAERVLGAGRWQARWEKGKVCYVRLESPFQYLHRFLCSPPPNFVVDHLNGNGLDNRKCNLRVVTQAHNAQNRNVIRASSGIRNVSWDSNRNKWAVYLCVNRRRIAFGRFDSIEEAERVAIEARKQHFPCSQENSSAP